MTKKIIRQLIRLSRPPATGPAAAPTEPPIAQTEIARARLARSGYASRSSASEAGTITAAPAP
ncbi:hypothetical protein AQI88_17935 [Streptomyces cellostaticus]|uniref:Uncharacterized protein n=1 Tax=Streptomyces cellostaticus TaxID=67285 RepID=A0A101NLJ7_9ACTN|nr:hypothetical protein AQI88_17935 [Streptomyces cellostaticus]GHI02061.1 hypothetical protein Scel_03820 [Streptomyces cellostaticus]